MGPNGLPEKRKPQGKRNENLTITVIMFKGSNQNPKLGLSMKHAVDRTLPMNIFCFDKSAVEIL
jgi:hypothetical protein